MKKIAITVGDPSSIACEIIKKWAFENKAQAEFCELIAHKSLLDTLPDYLSKREISKQNFELGKPFKEGSMLAYKALELAADGCKEGLYRAVVTAPVSKIEMNKAGYAFVGQTEFFESHWGGNAVMSFTGEKLLISLVTWHIPLKDVSNHITFEKIQNAVDAVVSICKKLRGIENPRIGVCGLNPHAGENGILGLEEIEKINPALDILREKYKNLSKALPPDTVFMRTLKGEFDGIVSMYHDQGLAPLKALEFDSAVNVSMGLKYIRTSPDHGTGFDIAGKNLASCKSFERAVFTAEKLSNP